MNNNNGSNDDQSKETSSNTKEPSKRGWLAKTFSFIFTPFFEIIYWGFKFMKKFVYSIIQRFKYIEVGVENDIKKIPYPNKKICIIFKKKRIKEYMEKLDEKEKEEEKNKYLIAYNQLYNLSIIRSNILLGLVILPPIFIVMILILVLTVLNPNKIWEELLHLIKKYSSIIIGGGWITSIVSVVTMYRNRISEMKKQSNWRGKVYEMERKEITSYSLNDLFIINSFINPYSSTSSTSHFVNEMIYNLYLGRKEIVDLCRAKLIEMLEKGIHNIGLPSYHSLLSLKEEDLKPNRILTREEALDVKLCCHVLLKAEWQGKI